MVHRAYSVLIVKSFEESERIIEGIATTPAIDRAGDILEPDGAEFSLPIPLLWQHDHRQPIGEVTHAKVTPDGIQIRAKLARVDTPGALQSRLDEAYQSVKAGLVRGLSVGLKPLEVKPIKGGYGLQILRWLWAELSAVTIPQNIQATIHSVKSADIGLYPALTGPVSLHYEGPPMTISEQVKACENTRAAKVARMTELLTKAGDNNQTLEGTTEATEYDSLSDQVKGLDKDLVRLHGLEEINKAAAVTVVPVTTSRAAGELRAGNPITVKSNLPPGTAFVRYCQAKAFGRGDSMRELAFAQQWKDSTPEVELMLKPETELLVKAAVAAGTTSDAVWAGPLAPIKPLADEFLALLRPATILGKIPNFKRVPFNISVPIQTGGGTYKWVAQNVPKPVGSLAFNTLTLGITKCAGIIVITDELAKNSSPSAEAVIRADMIAGIAAFLDVEFTDPSKAPATGVPGSITNGVTPITTAGTTPANARTDIQALINAMTATGISTVGAALIMSETNAAALGSALNALGQPLFGDLTVSGGTAMGIKVFPSQSAGNNVILVQPSTVLYADDGGVTIDVSTEASVQMDNAPMSPPDATVVMTSLWQNNLVGLRAERYINWKRGRTGGVQYTVATYSA